MCSLSVPRKFTKLSPMNPFRKIRSSQVSIPDGACLMSYCAQNITKVEGGLFPGTLIVTMDVVIEAVLESQPVRRGTLKPPLTLT